MRVVLMCGSHRRHAHVARILAIAGHLEGLVVERREEMVPEPPNGLDPADERNFRRHFAERDDVESGVFGPAELPSGVPTTWTTKEDLNSATVRKFVTQLRPELVLSFGVHLLAQDALAEYQRTATTWNLHGGLSPWYRGTATLFWPFFFLRPHWAGMTVHELVRAIDGGGIIHHSVPTLARGDGIHDVGARAVTAVTDDIVRLLDRLDSGATVEPQVQRSSGKLFLNADFQPQQLRVIYDLFDNDIVDAYLDGALSTPPPELLSAL